jgi:hypothetical protein
MIHVDTPDKIKCFLLEPNGMEFRSLRRYSSAGSCPLMPGEYSYHNSQIDMPAGPDDGEWGNSPLAKWLDRFPQKCECGFKYTDNNSNRQLFSENQYICSEKAGEIFSIRDAPAGAIWRVPWYEDIKDMCGTDGKSYICMTPGGQWCIDSRAKNCGLPNDSNHKCWVRHGEAPVFTVDKRGVTCNAGAGSIQAGNYHGFLINGFLVTNTNLAV